MALLVEALGTAAAVCSTASFLPQVVRLWRTRDGSGISLKTYLATVAAFGLWTAYGALRGSWPLVGSSAANLSLAAAILVLKLRFPGRRAPSEPEGP